MLEQQIHEYIKQKKMVIIADVAKNFQIHHATASDLIKELEKKKMVTITNRGIAKIVTPLESGDVVATN